MFKLIPFLTVLINCLKKRQIQQVLLLVPSSGLHNQECHISSQRARPCGQKIKRHTCGNESFDSTWCQELLSNSPLPKTSAATRNQWNCSSPSFSTVHTLCRSCLNFTNGRHAVNISKLRPRNRKSKNGKQHVVKNEWTHCTALTLFSRARLQWGIRVWLRQQLKSSHCIQRQEKHLSKKFQPPKVSAHTSDIQKAKASQPKTAFRRNRRHPHFNPCQVM